MLQCLFDDLSTCSQGLVYTYWIASVQHRDDLLGCLFDDWVPRVWFTGTAGAERIVLGASKVFGLVLI